MYKFLFCLYFILLTFNLSAESSLDGTQSQTDIIPFTSIAKTAPTEQSSTGETTLLQAQASGLLPEEIGGYACNVSHTPDDEMKWSINLYNLNNGLHSVKTIFSTNKNKNIQSVACTPNGRYVLFSMRDNPRGDYEIYSMDLTGTEVVQLTANDTDDVDVTMSENGLTRAWQSRLSDGRQAINLRTYSSPTDYSDRTLASASPFVQPSLSPNGDWLVLLQLKNNFILNRYNIKDNSWLSIKSVPRRIKMYHPSISDDGNKIGWLERTNQSLFFVKDIENNLAQIVLNIPTGISHPTITHDGKWLSYGVNDEQGGKTQLTYLETGETIQLGDSLSSGNRYLATNWMGRFVNESGESNGYGGCVTIGEPDVGLKFNYRGTYSTTVVEASSSINRYINDYNYEYYKAKNLIEDFYEIQGGYKYLYKTKTTNLNADGESFTVTYDPPLKTIADLACVGLTIINNSTSTTTLYDGTTFDEDFYSIEKILSVSAKLNGMATVKVDYKEKGYQGKIYYDVLTSMIVNDLESIEYVDVSEYE